jgi:hypothetical protein
MSTSANVTYYTVKYKDGTPVGEYWQNRMCKDTVSKQLKSHIPAEDYMLSLRWPDEDEAPHYTKPMSLADYLNGIKVEWKD